MFEALSAGLFNGLIYAAVAVGLALIWGITDVINFIRTAWTNRAPPIASDEVAHIRGFLASKKPNIVSGGKHE